MTIRNTRTRFITYRRKGKSPRRYTVGYMDVEGRHVIRARFDEGRLFSEGLAGVKIGKRWGYINESGKIVIPATLSSGRDFSEDRVGVYLGRPRSQSFDHWCLMDRSGALIGAAKYTCIGSFSEGLAWVRGKGDMHGYVNRQGDEVIPLVHEEAANFTEGLAAAKSCGKWGYIDRDNNFVIPPRFDGWGAGTFVGGLARVCMGAKWGYINKLGEMVIEARFDMALEFSEGLAKVKVGDLYGYIDLRGNMVIPPTYRHAGSFSEGLARAEKGELAGFIHPDGSDAIAPWFLLTGRFQGGLCFVETQCEIGYINSAGDFVWRGPYVEADFTANPML